MALTTSAQLCVLTGDTTWAQASFQPSSPFCWISNSSNMQFTHWFKMALRQKC